MIEGMLDIFWENHKDANATPKYRLKFDPHQKISITLSPRTLVGDAALLDYLMDMQTRSAARARQHAKEWLAEITAHTTLSLDLVTFTDEQLNFFKL